MSRLIDADKLQERAYQMRFDTRITEGGLALINYLLSDAPTIDPVKHGRWRKMNGERGYECSECGWESDTTWDFCPNCGANMIDGESYED